MSAGQGIAAASSAFVELVRALLDEVETVEILSILAERSVEVLSARHAGVYLRGADGRVRLVAASHEDEPVLTALERVGDELLADGSARSLTNLDLLGGPWPGMVRTAGSAGLGLLHGFRLQVRGDGFGVLLVVDAERRLDDGEAEIGQALADVCSLVMLQHRIARDARVLAAQLQDALQSRVVLEQAKGVLAERGRIGVDDAFGRLRRVARRRRTALSELAASVVRGEADDELLAELLA